MYRSTSNNILLWNKELKMYVVNCHQTSKSLTFFFIELK